MECGRLVRPNVLVPKFSLGNPAKSDAELPELYRLTDWSADGSSANLGAYDNLDPEMQSIVMGLAQRIYDGEKITYDPDLLNATVKPYLDGIAKGYGKTLADVDWNTPDAKTLQKLTENVFQFSASKDFHILSDMTAALKGSDGKMRSFDDFQAEVDKMNVKYNQNWLRTEYNQAVASSQCAARWTDFEKHAKSMPFLQYQAVMDGNTRAEHAALNGVIKRVDSDFWDKYYPPNGWGCRCEVIQLPGKNHKETPAEAIKFCKVDDMWKVNVGKKGVVFPKGHPYFMGQCQTNSCPLKSRKLAATENPQCAACIQGMGDCGKYVEECKEKAENYAAKQVAAVKGEGRNQIIKTKDGIVDYAQKILAQHNYQSKEFLPVGVVKQWLQDDFQKRIGGKIADTDIIILPEHITKYREHPKNDKGKAVPVEEYDKIIDVVNNPDNVYFVKNNKYETYAFTKRYDDLRIIKVILHPNYKKDKDTSLCIVKSWGIIEERGMRNRTLFEQIK